jgi:hypothetical protein
VLLEYRHCCCPLSSVRRRWRIKKMKTMTFVHSDLATGWANRSSIPGSGNTLLSAPQRQDSSAKLNTRLRLVLRLTGETRPLISHTYWCLIKPLKSELLYDWRFSANHFILASSPLRPTSSIFFFKLSLAVVVLMLHPLWWEEGFVVYHCCWSSPAQSFSGQSPAGLMTIFYNLKLETPPNWRVRSPYIYPPGTG